MSTRPDTFFGGDGHPETPSSPGWFKLNDGNLFPGQSPRRFFELDRELLHTSSMSRHEDLTQRGGGSCFSA